MPRLIKSTSKKTLKEADIPVHSDDNIEDAELKVVLKQTLSESDDDEAPEAVSMSTSKAEIISQIKSEREARRLEREMKRKKSVHLQEQNRQARLRKSKEVEAVEDEISESEDDAEKEKEQNEICPLPENILETAIEQQQQKKTCFDSESEEESTDFIASADIAETVRSQRAKATKRRLIQSLPYAVVEVGVNGKARISKAEIKSRRAISKLKLEKAGAQVRRIDSVIDRARKNRTAAVVFYRKNSFY